MGSENPRKKKRERQSSERRRRDEAVRCQRVLDKIEKQKYETPCVRNLPPHPTSAGPSRTTAMSTYLRMPSQPIRKEQQGRGEYLRLSTTSPGSELGSPSPAYIHTIAARRVGEIASNATLPTRKKKKKKKTATYHGDFSGQRRRADEDAVVVRGFWQRLHVPVCGLRHPGLSLLQEPAASWRAPEVSSAGVIVCAILADMLL